MPVTPRANFFPGRRGRAARLHDLYKLILMGIFWDLLQQDELDKQQEKAKDLEGRVARLEEELQQTRALLKKTLAALETHLSKDIDGDGVAG